MFTKQRPIFMHVKIRLIPLIYLFVPSEIFSRKRKLFHFSCHGCSSAAHFCCNKSARKDYWVRSEASTKELCATSSVIVSVSFCVEFKKKRIYVLVENDYMLGCCLRCPLRVHTNTHTYGAISTDCDDYAFYSSLLEREIKTNNLCGVDQFFVFIITMVSVEEHCGSIVEEFYFKKITTTT